MPWFQIMNHTETKVANACRFDFHTEEIRANKLALQSNEKVFSLASDRADASRLVLNYPAPSNICRVEDEHLQELATQYVSNFEGLNSSPVLEYLRTTRLELFAPAMQETLIAINAISIHLDLNHESFLPTIRVSAEKKIDVDLDASSAHNPLDTPYLPCYQSVRMYFALATALGGFLFRNVRTTRQAALILSDSGKFSSSDLDRAQFEKNLRFLASGQPLRVWWTDKLLEQSEWAEGLQQLHEFMRSTLEMAIVDAVGFFFWECIHMPTPLQVFLQLVQRQQPDLHLDSELFPRLIDAFERGDVCEFLLVITGKVGGLTKFSELADHLHIIAQIKRSADGHIWSDSDS